MAVVKSLELLFNCPGCRATRDGNPPTNHSEECRARVEKHLFEKGDTRVETSYDRILKHYGRQVESEKKTK